MDVRRVISGLDALNSAGKENEGEAYLERWYEDARAEGDYKSELSILSEMLGQYRKCGSAGKGLDACEKAIAMVEKLGIGQSATGATILINAATTMKAFGKAKESIPIFLSCEETYQKTLEKGDYRMAPLYNNMALSYQDISEYEKAEEYFFKAIDALGGIENCENDKAASYCNLAELYYAQGKDESSVNQMLENAYVLLCTPTLRRDSYHSFTLSKCIPSFDYFGMFLYSKELKERKKVIDAQV